MLKRLKPLVVVAALVLTLGFSPNVFAIDADEAQATADLLINAVAVPAVNAVTMAAIGADESTIEVLTEAVHILVNNNDLALISGRPIPTLLGGKDNQPRGSVEATALEEALNTGSQVTVVDGSLSITVAPLAVVEGCPVCHNDYTQDGLTNGDGVGGVVVRVRINEVSP